MDTVTDTSCIVYKEMCPLRKEAIALEEREIMWLDGTVGVIQLPQRQPDLCIGSETCENM